MSCLCIDVDNECENVIKTFKLTTAYAEVQ